MTISSSLVSNLKSLATHPVKYIATFLQFQRSTDIERWKNAANLSPDWDDRTRLIAELIPENSSVIEFGAARLVLPKYLDSSCTYQPVDLVKRSEDTIVFDLNDSLPVLHHHYNYAVFSGVLEYIHDIDRLICWLQDITDGVIFSYSVTDMLSDPITRRNHGWVNSLSDAEVRQLISHHKLELLSTHQWQRQNIYIARFPTTNSFSKLKA